MNRNNQYTDESHQVSVDGIKNLYRKFLFFKHFHFLKEPLIFCEGKTDNIYLKCAINQLRSSYPALVEENEGELEYKVKFFNRTETASEMLKMAEGAGGMKFILLSYERLMEKFKCVGRRHPVIMIVDDDKEGKGVIKAASKYSSSKRPHPNHVVQNLYLFKLPSLTTGDTELEDYFKKEVLEEKLNGKSFNRKNDSADDRGEYGKAAFARDVVKRKQGSIDFSDFKKILDTVTGIIDDFPATT